MAFDLIGAVAHALVERRGLSNPECDALSREGQETLRHDAERLNLNIDRFHSGLPVNAEIEGRKVTQAPVAEGDGYKAHVVFALFECGGDGPVVVGPLEGNDHFKAPLLSKDGSVEASAGRVPSPCRARRCAALITGGPDVAL